MNKSRQTRKLLKLTRKLLELLLKNVQKYVFTYQLNNCDITFNRLDERSCSRRIKSTGKIITVHDNMNSTVQKNWKDDHSTRSIFDCQPGYDDRRNVMVHVQK